MNCKLCNEANKEYYNYCLNDGSYLNNVQNPYLIKSNTNRNCSFCNKHNDEYNNYCIECGAEIYNFTK